MTSDKYLCTGNARYFFNRGELEIIYTQLERVGIVGSSLSLAEWCRHLTQMVDKLYGQVATLEHEIQRLKEQQP